MLVECVLPLLSVCEALVAYFLKSSKRVCGNSLLTVILELSTVVSDVLVLDDFVSCVADCLPLDCDVFDVSAVWIMSCVTNGSNFSAADSYSWLK